MLNLVIAGVLLPLVASVLLWRRPRRPAGGWIATFVLAAGMTAFACFSVAWGFLGMSLRYAVAGLFLAATVVSLRRPVDERADDSPTRILLKVLIGLFFGSVALGVLRANSQPPDVVNVAFPLKTGTYAVVHGGSTTAANTYFGRGAEGWAVEVVRTDGPMANQPLVSPCDGAVESGGVRCGDLVVHFAPANLAKPGPVRRGDLIGRGAAGASPAGTTAAEAAAAPQTLRIHAERKGQPVPLTFDGRWLVRNAVIRR